MNEKKKVSIELNLTNDQYIQFFDYLKFLEVQWECQEVPKNDGKTIADDLFEYLMKDSMLVRSPRRDTIWAFAAENRMMLKDFLDEVNDVCKSDPDALKKQLFEYFKHFMDKMRLEKDPREFINDKYNEDKIIIQDILSDDFEEEFQKTQNNHTEFKSLVPERVTEEKKLEDINKRREFMGAILQCKGDIHKISEMLHISKSTIYKKIKDFDLKEMYIKIKSSEN